MNTFESKLCRETKDAFISQRERRLFAIIENSPSALSVKDLTGRYLIANKNFDKILGISSEMMIGKTAFDIFPFEVAEVITKNDKRVIETKSRHSFEETISNSDGIPLIFSSFKFPIFDQEGKIESLCSISLDVTEKKNLRPLRP